MEKIKKPRKITKQRLKNIALYYLERFETSQANLRAVLQRRIDKYAFFMPDFDKAEANMWADETVKELADLNYVNDNRFAEMKIKDYLAAGKPKRYIAQKLQEKGIATQDVADLLEKFTYDEFETALKFARKKKIASFRESADLRRDFRQKDMGTLARAGFSYDVVLKVLDFEA